MVSVGSSGPGSSPGRGQCVVFLGRSLLLSSQFSRGRFDPFPPFLRPATQTKTEELKDHGLI